MKNEASEKSVNIYRKTREELGLSRDKASELLDGISPDRIEKIEGGKFIPHPEEILLMSEKYKAAGLRNYSVPMNVRLERNMFRRSRSRTCHRLPSK